MCIHEIYACSNLWSIRQKLIYTDQWQILKKDTIEKYEVPFIPTHVTFCESFIIQKWNA